VKRQEENSAPLGEVMSSSITGFIAEVWADSQASVPGFGALVRSFSQEHKVDVLGVVYDVVTGPADSQHRPVALHMSREQLKLEQPHIFSLLKTELHVAVCAHKRDKMLLCRLPPYPPSVHDFVYPVSRVDASRLGDDLDFLSLLLRISAVPQDELIASCLQLIAAAREDEYEFLVRAGRHLSQLYRNDYDTLTGLLRKIRPVSGSG
jgi:hypothetical protein